jgi:aryl-alcohol dehydrogenase-like predicted oxidoreductase
MEGETMSAQGQMLYRTLGRTGEKVSAIGIGGGHIGRSASDEEAIRIMRTAIDNGVNFMDNCWDYHGGLSEERMGKALRDGYREKAFLMTKIDGQTKASALAQLDESMRRLEVDVVDLVQFHEVIRPEDPERIFAPGGAFEAMMEAKEKGKVRYIGFTGHKDPDIHLKMLETGFGRGFTFDAVQMPLNVMDAHYRSFEKKVLPVLLKHNIGVLGMKTVGGYTILLSRLVQPLECIQYVMNLPVSVVITGCDSMERLEQSLTAARTFRPLSQEEVDSILARTAKPASRGRYEIFKSTNVHDGTMFNPHWLGLEA